MELLEQMALAHRAVCAACDSWHNGECDSCLKRECTALGMVEKWLREHPPIATESAGTVWPRPSTLADELAAMKEARNG